MKSHTGQEGLQALTAHLIFADLALLFCAHSSADGRMASDAVWLYTPSL